MNENQLKTLTKLFLDEYSILYDGKKPESTAQIDRFDEMSANNAGFQAILTAFAHYRHDIITSDRECNAFMNVYDYLMTV